MTSLVVIAGLVVEKGEEERKDSGEGVSGKQASLDFA